jgi:hypothetical protein
MKRFREYVEAMLTAVGLWACVLGIIWIVTQLADAVDHIR